MFFSSFLVSLARSLTHDCQIFPNLFQSSCSFCVFSRFLCEILFSCEFIVKFNFSEVTKHFYLFKKVFKKFELYFLTFNSKCIMYFWISWFLLKKLMFPFKVLLFKYFESFLFIPFKSTVLIDC